MKTRKSSKIEDTKVETLGYKEKVQIDNKGRLYIDSKDLANSPVFRQQLAKVAKIRIENG